MNDFDEFHSSPLWYASYFSSSDAVSLLLERGADINSVNLNEETPLMVAVIEEHLDVVRVLLKHGPNITLKERHGCTALDYAVDPHIGALLRKYAGK